MRNLWFFFLVGLSTGFISEKLFVSSMPPTTDDLYIEGLTSGDSTVDDDDEGDDDSDGSGSGSGDYAFSDLSDEERQLGKFFNLSRTILEEILPIQPQPTTDAPNKPTTTVAGRRDSAEDTRNSLPSNDHRDDLIPEKDSTSTTSSTATEVPLGETTELEDVEQKVLEKKDDTFFSEGGQNSRIDDMNSAEEVTSENLWERTDVLAAVIACGVVGFLCAIFLLMLLAYRMKKKDEGSYDLGDIKLSATAYHKAPTKEFYA